MSLSWPPPGGQDRNVDGVDESMIFAELARPLRGMDFTDRIMQRWRRDTGRLTHRMRLGRWLGGAIVGFAAIAIVVAALMVGSGERVSGPTIPAALRHDWNRHGQTIGRTIKSIQQLSPHLPAQPNVAPLPGAGEQPGPDEPSEAKTSGRVGQA